MKQCNSTEHKKRKIMYRENETGIISDYKM